MYNCNIGSLRKLFGSATEGGSPIYGAENCEILYKQLGQPGQDHRTNPHSFLNPTFQTSICFCSFKLD